MVSVWSVIYKRDFKILVWIFKEVVIGKIKNFFRVFKEFKENLRLFVVKSISFI